MLSPLQPTFSEHFRHHERLIKVQLLGSRLFIKDNYSLNEITLNFDTYFSTEQDSYGNLTSISIYGERVVHLAHSNPTVLEQWASLLHLSIHKIGLHKDYVILDKIGEGVSATVYLGKAEKSGEKVAIKAFSKKKMQKRDWQALQNQIKILRMAENDYFSKLFGTYLTQNSIYLVMEYASGSNLKEITEKDAIDLREKKRILMDVGIALSILHKNQIVHRDIKAQNIIYNKNTKLIKIIDFGFSVFLPDKCKAYKNCGTPGYAAPQTFRKDYEPSASNDVFSLGVLAHFLLSGKLPFRQHGRSILLDSKDCKFSFSSQLKRCPSLLNPIKKMVCH